MNKQLEVFDAVANTVKQVFNNILSAQQGLSVQWMSGLSKTQVAVTSIPGLPENAQTKEVLSHLNSWFSTVATSSQSASEEVLKAQQNWLSAYDKQVAVSRDFLKSIIALSSVDSTQAALPKVLPKAALPKALPKADLVAAV